MDQIQSGMRNRIQVGTTHFLSRLEESVRYGLLEEVRTTPKPGLVDLCDSGAHTDMDYNTFAVSTGAVTPYIVKMAEAGLELYDRPERIFPVIREIGILGEHAMFRATKGVNTHKGILFMLGILAAAYGAAFRKGGNRFPDRRTVLSEAKKIAAPSLERELKQIPGRERKTHGENLYVRYGIRGVRGEVLDGFPSLSCTAFPAMESAKRIQPDKNAARLHVLLHLMACVEDTNILSRSGPATLRKAQRISVGFLKAYPVIHGEAMDRLREMNQMFIRWGISPGGCADLLAVTLFFENMQKIAYNKRKFEKRDESNNR